MADNQDDQYHYNKDILLITHNFRIEYFVKLDFKLGTIDTIFMLVNTEYTCLYHLHNQQEADIHNEHTLSVTIGSMTGNNSVKLNL